MILLSSWMALARALIVGIAAYIGLVIFQRLTGKRTLSKMNAFDLIVTVALGSSLATVILSKSIGLLEGLLTFALLMALQFAVTWLSVKSKLVTNIVKSNPTLLFYKGKLLKGAMHKERVVEDEVLQAVRESGFASLNDVEAVVLETNGKFSVIKKSANKDDSALANVER